MPKNKFSASRGEMIRLADEEITQETEELFLKAEIRHGITRTYVEVKKAAQRILKGENLVFIKANLMSNHHIIYDVLSLAEKKVAVLFLHPPLEPVYKPILQKSVVYTNLEGLATLEGIDVLFVENLDLFEDLAQPELRALKAGLQRLPCSKVLVGNLMAYRSFSLLKEEIGQPFPGISLPGMKIENIQITASKADNRVLEIKNLLKQVGPQLREDDLILIITNSQTEANDLYKQISQGGDLSKYVSIANIYFGPINNPPLTSIYTLVIYYNLPRKMEQLYAQISMQYTNYYFKKYSKMSSLPKIHFHLLVSRDDYCKARFRIFQKRISRLQINRLFKYIDDMKKQWEKEQKNAGIEDVEVEQVGPEKGSQRLASGKIYLKELGNSVDMVSVMIIRALRLAQNDKKIQIGLPVPISYSVRPIVQVKQNTRLQKLLENATRTKAGTYQFTLQQVTEWLGQTPHEAQATIRSLQLEGLIAVEIDDECIEVVMPNSFSETLQETSEKVYQKLLNESQLEADLLKYLFLVLSIGSTPTSSVGQQRGMNQNLVALLRQYALAEHEQIPDLFPQNSIEDTLEPVRGTPQELQEMQETFQFLLSKNRKTFMRKELDLCRGPGAQVGKEYVQYSLVRTLCSQPPRNVAHEDLVLPPLRFDPLKLDFESLLSAASAALNIFLQSS